MNLLCDLQDVLWDDRMTYNFAMKFQIEFAQELRKIILTTKHVNTYNKLKFHIIKQLWI